MIDEHKKGVKAMKYASKPRNFVAKNMTTSGAGPHKDKKKADKQGEVKHKKRDTEMAENFNPEYDDEAGMAQGSLHTLKRAVDGLMDTIDDNDNLPEWCQEKISLAEDYLVTVWDYIQSEKSQGVAEGLGKDIKRLATGKDVKSRAGQEIAKSQDASMKGDTKTSKKHFDRYDKLDKLANKEQGVAESNWYELRLHTLLESKLK
jgi:hypothetical protein